MNKELLPLYQLHHFLMQSAERMYLALMHMAQLTKSDPHHMFPAWHMEYTLGAMEVHRARRIVEDTWSFRFAAPQAAQAANDWRHVLDDPSVADAWWTTWESYVRDMPERRNLVFSLASNKQAKGIYQALCALEQLVAQGTYVAFHVDPRTVESAQQAKYFQVLHAFGPSVLHEGGMNLIAGLPIVPRPYRYDVEEMVTSVHQKQSGALDAFLDTLLRNNDSQS